MKPRRSRIVRSAAALAAVLALVAPVAAACGAGGKDGASVESDRQRTLRLARFELAAAAKALLAGDKAAFDDWLPVDDAAGSGPGPRASLDAVYDTLSALPWRTFAFDVSVVEGTSDVFRVAGSGQLGGAGPPDRLAVVRYLRLHGVADGAVVLADVTPEALRRRYLMALRDPVVVRRPGVIVLADRLARDRAETVAAAATRARTRLGELGLDTGEPVVTTVFGSVEDARDALGLRQERSPLAFFAYPALRVAEDDWPVLDIGVVGPWLRDLGPETDGVLRHELAHAFSLRWFREAGREPALLVEGIAEAAEGARPRYLRDEVASGDQLWPLPGSFAEEDLWEGNDGAAVALGYEVGGSLVEYVTARWGPARLRAFALAVAGAEPTEAGLDEALRGALGVTWRRFYEGWRRWVLAGT